MPPLFIGIATAGRREVLTAIVTHLSQQSLEAVRILICPADPADVDEPALAKLPAAVSVLRGGRGLCAQRNAIIRELADQSDGLLAFFDDDFLPAVDYSRQVSELFDSHPDVVMATGTVLADDILGPGLSPSDGQAELARRYQAPAGEPVLTDVYNGYGCNMIMRLAPVLAHGLTFDETLPLYGWLEDVDFSRQLKPYGRIVRSSNLQGVHLGSKRGRSLGKRLGYSQIANPAYLVGKRTFTLGRALQQMSRNVGANLVGVANPEPWIDRRGRLIGNALGMRDFVAGRLHPGRITSID